MKKIKKILEKRKVLGRLINQDGNAGVEESPYRPEFDKKKAPCSVGCPSGTKIREVLKTIADTEKEGRSFDESFRKAWKIIMETNPFPAVCGRVCPHPCEESCNRQFKDSPVAINNIERFLGDFAIGQALEVPNISEDKHPEKIAVIGAGPAGLSAAYQLARRGYDIDVFESFPRPGGMLRYGIPDYRLPQDVLDKEIERIKRLGVKISCNTTIGRDISYDDLENKYDAVFVGIGAHKGRTLGLDNENAENIFTGTEFLNKVNSKMPPGIGGKVLVVGGGDTAIDAARVSKRLGADVELIYRRTRKEMPAIESEIIEAEEEGIKMSFLLQPVEIIAEGGKPSKLKCSVMSLGDPDDSGRRRPVPVEGEFKEFNFDTLISAISQSPDKTGLEKALGNKNEKVFAGGDVLDLGLVTIAIFQGRKAAETIHNKFRGIEADDDIDRQVADKTRILYDYYSEKARHEAYNLPPDERIQSLEKEVKCCLKEDEAFDEALRCMSCGSCFDCGTCWDVCGESITPAKNESHEGFNVRINLCKGCGHCADACPCGFIEMMDPDSGVSIKSAVFSNK